MNQNHPSFCVVQNENNRHSFMWVGPSRSEGKWVELQPKDYENMKAMVEVLCSVDDPVDILREIAQQWAQEFGDPENDNDFI